MQMDLTTYKNSHLTEVICGFNFLGNSPWDSTYFGQYYERIKNQGFTEKQERKGLQIEISNNPNQIIRSNQPIDDQVVFQNPTLGWAIAMGRNKLSFHVLRNYISWSDFRDKLVIPFYKIYEDLGLGKGRRESNMMYLNRFTKDISVELSDYFTIVSRLEYSFGMEANTFIQRTFQPSGNLLITKLNSQLLPNGKKDIVLECGAICRDNKLMSGTDWIAQADYTHEPIRSFFEAIITDKLRKEL